MGLRDVAYSLYERRLLAGLDSDRIPRHVGVILDGNRRARITENWRRELPEQSVVYNLDVEGYIFDGFPRTVPQADALDNLLAENGNEVSLLLMLDVPDDELVKRLLLRGETSGRADDTDESIIRNRIEVYKSETTPVFDYYAAKGKAAKVYGVGEIEEIFARLCAEIDHHA